MRLALAFLVVVVSLSGCVGQFLTGELDDPVPAPPFQAVDIDGRHWNLTELQGRTVLLDFMGTWCGPCQRSVPLLRDMQAAYPDLVVLSVSGTDGRQAMDDFRVQYNAPWPHIADADLVRDVHRSVAGDATMIWPSYAIIDGQGDIRFYNRGETLPATFTAALDSVTVREAPSYDLAATPLLVLAFLLGAAAWFSPFLLAHTVAERRRPAWSPLAGLGLYLAVAALATWGSRPISGRIVVVAPWLAAAGALAVVWWRVKGTEAVQVHGKRLEHEHAAWRVAGFWGNTLWYMLPALGAVLYAAMLRTAPMETFGLVAAFAVGLAATEAAAMAPRVRAGMQSLEHRAGWIGAGALLVGLLWNGALYLR